MANRQDQVFDTFAAEYDQFLEMHPELQQWDGDAFEMLSFHPDLTPRQRHWLADFCIRFNEAMDEARQQDEMTPGVLEQARWHDTSAELE